MKPNRRNDPAAPERRQLRRRLPVALVLVLALTLTACGSGSDGDEDVAADDGAPAAPSTEGSAGGDAEPEPEPEPSAGAGVCGNISIADFEFRIGDDVVIEGDDNGCTVTQAGTPAYRVTVEPFDQATFDGAVAALPETYVGLGISNDAYVEGYTSSTADGPGEVAIVHFGDLLLTAETLGAYSTATMDVIAEGFVE